MKVTVHFKDRSYTSIEISPVMAQQMRGPADAIAWAKKHIGETRLREMEKHGIARWEVEEDFL